LRERVYNPRLLEKRRWESKQGIKKNDDRRLNSISRRRKIRKRRRRRRPRSKLTKTERVIQTKTSSSSFNEIDEIER
jgi:hypothetical protein